MLQFLVPATRISLVVIVAVADETRHAVCGRGVNPETLGSVLRHALSQQRLIIFTRLNLAEFTKPVHELIGMTGICLPCRYTWMAVVRLWCKQCCMTCADAAEPQRFCTRTCPISRRCTAPSSSDILSSSLTSQRSLRTSTVSETVSESPHRSSESTKIPDPRIKLYMPHITYRFERWGRTCMVTAILKGPRKADFRSA